MKTYHNLYKLVILSYKMIYLLCSIQAYKKILE